MSSGKQNRKKNSQKPNTARGTASGAAKRAATGNTERYNPAEARATGKTERYNPAEVRAGGATRRGETTPQSAREIGRTDMHHSPRGSKRELGFWEKCVAFLSMVGAVIAGGFAIAAGAAAAFGKKLSAGVEMGFVRMAVIILAVALFLGGGGYGLYWFMTHINGQVVSINSTQIGVIKLVKNKEITGEYLQDLAVKKLEQQVGAHVQVNESVTTELVHASSKDFVTEDYIVNEILKSFTYLVETASITVDGYEMALVRTEKEADEILQNIKNAYLQDGLDIKEVSFVEAVDTTPVFRSEDEIISTDRAYEILTANIIEEQIYVVKKGDSLGGIAANAGMMLNDLLALNPEYTPTTILPIGATLTLTVPKPLLSVETRESVKYTAVMEKPVEIRYNDDEHKSYTRILQQGKEGQEEITADIVRVNGFEIRKDIIDRVTLVPPVTEIKEVGTSNTNPKRALGSFIMPTYGTITDYFGTRSGRHNGVDIANSRGTPIYASDGGVVTKAKNSGDGYGNQVVIDHGNGFVTSYAHNSSILVSVGQKVAQGEVIAKMGSTGNSTGNHCHFEMFLYGTHVNPFKYVQ